MRNVRGERRTRPGTGRPGVNMVGKADFRSYYGRPILKRPVWTWEVPAYMFLGGIAGAAAATTIASKGARSGAPSVPSPVRTSTRSA